MNRSKIVPVTNLGGYRGYILRAQDLPEHFWDKHTSAYYLDDLEDSLANYVSRQKAAGYSLDHCVPTGNKDAGGCKRGRSGIIWLLANTLDPFLETEHNEWGEISP